MKTSKQPLWTKDFIIIFISTLFVFASFYLLMTIFSVYTITHFQASQSLAGLASGIFIIGALVFRFITGRIIDSIDPKKMVLLGLFLFLAATILYFAASNIFILFLVRFIHGGAFGIAATSMATSVMNIIPNERRGEGTGYYALSTTVASAIGPFLGLFLIKYADYNMIFFVCSLFAVISLLISLFTKPQPPKRKEHVTRNNQQGFNIANYFETKAIPIAIVGSMMTVAYSGILTFINSYAKEIELTSAASFYFIVFAIFILISRPITGPLLDIKGDNIVIYPAILSFVIALFILSEANSSFTLLLSAAFVGLGYGTMLASTQAIAVKESPQNRVGLATSTFFICTDIGMGVGPYIHGLLIPAIGYSGLFKLLGCIVFLALFVYYALHGKKDSERRKIKNSIEA